MASVGTKRFWTEFIDLYRSLPEVWNITCNKYKNRVLKAQAYDKLTEKLQEIDEEADRDAVIKKINTLRGNYRRELKKVLRSERSGEAFESPLWYFNQLDFLRQIMKPAEPQSEERGSFEFIDNTTQMGSSYNGTINTEERKPKRRRLDDDEVNTSNYNQQPKDNRLKFLETAVQIMRGTRDEAEIYANVWAAEYRKLDNMQRLHAKRAIDEILYQGRFGNLTFQSVNIVTADSRDESSNHGNAEKEFALDGKDIILEDDEQYEEDQNGVDFEEEETLEFEENKPIITVSKNLHHTQNRQCTSKFRRS